VRVHATNTKTKVKLKSAHFLQYGGLSCVHKINFLVRRNVPQKYLGTYYLK